MKGRNPRPERHDRPDEDEEILDAELWRRRRQLARLDVPYAQRRDWTPIIAAGALALFAGGGVTWFSFQHSLMTRGETMEAIHNDGVEDRKVITDRLDATTKNVDRLTDAVGTVQKTQNDMAIQQEKIAAAVNQITKQLDSIVQTVPRFPDGERRHP